METLCLLDISSLSIMKPAKVWSMAGLDSIEVRKSTVVNWMTLGVYKTREALHTMKIIKSPQCTACSMNAIGSLSHYLIYCPFTAEIREKYVPQFVLANPKVASLANNETALLISILDPESSLLPEEIRHNWESSKKIYALSHDQICLQCKKINDTFYKKKG